MQQLYILASELQDPKFLDLNPIPILAWKWDLNQNPCLCKIISVFLQSQSQKIWSKSWSRSPWEKYLNPDHDPKIWDMIPKDHRSLKIMQFTDITYTRVWV